MVCTLVAICNKKDITDEFQENLSTQIGVEYSYIQIDNYNNNLNSARNAFNKVLDKTNGEYIIFLHPDIRFLHAESLRHVVDYCKQVGEFGVIGVAGAKSDASGKRAIYTHILNGNNRINPGIDIRNPIEVQTVDECMFIVKRELINRYNFPEKQGFHLYATEYCLLMLKKGYTNYVVPAEIWHLSEGRSLDPNYMKQLETIIKDYKNDFDVIYTTVKKWTTKGLLAYIYRKYYYFKQCIKRII